MMLLKGSGVLVDLRGSPPYYKLSSDQGNAKAQCNYGSMLFGGEGVLMNKSLAAYYLKLASH
jgi:TPR repeat protein